MWLFCTWIQKNILLFHDCFMLCCETRLMPMVCYRPGSYSAGHVQTTVLLEMEKSTTQVWIVRILMLISLKTHQTGLIVIKRSWRKTEVEVENQLKFKGKTPNTSPPPFLTATPGWALSFVGEMKTEQSVQDATEREVSGVVSIQPSSASFGPRSDHDQYSTQRLTDTWNKEWQQNILLFRTKSFPDMKRKPSSFYW